MAKYEKKTAHTAKTYYNSKSSYLRPNISTKLYSNSKNLELK